MMNLSKLGIQFHDPFPVDTGASQLQPLTNSQFHFITFNKDINMLGAAVNKYR